MLILGIETSCDETGLALVEAGGGLAAPKFKIVKEAVASQVREHAPFGGVVPMLAKREHLKNLPVLYRKIFGANEEKIWKKIGFISVTTGPGLEPALWAGIEFAKGLAAERKKPLRGANHLEGHLYSFLLPQTKKIPGDNPKKIFPAVALVVSGGHTILLSVQSLKKWHKLGETRDDAVGEAFDKVARMLSLPYPGGPQVERLAKTGDAKAIPFPRPMLAQKNYEFSFSGLKTAVLYHLRDNPDAQPADVAASFTAAVADVLAAKTGRALRDADANSLLISGGVAANNLLRTRFAREAKSAGANFLVAAPKWNTDNAVMIASASYINFLRGKNLKLEARGDLSV